MQTTRGPGGAAAWAHGADIGQMAIFLGVIGTVADRKHITDREADEINRYRDLPPLRLVKQCARPEIADPAFAQLGGGIGDSSPSIDDVVDEQYRSPCKTGRDIAEKLPGIERQPGKKLEPSAERLLAVLHLWRDEAIKAGFLRQREARGISEVTHTSVASMRSAIQSSAASAVSPTRTMLTFDIPGGRIGREPLETTKTLTSRRTATR
jgi:hypothetical protein